MAFWLDCGCDMGSHQPGGKGEGEWGESSAVASFTVDFALNYKSP